MMTRHFPRRNFPRSSHNSSHYRPSVRNNSIHCFRSIFLYFFLLSLLSQKTFPHSRNWSNLTSSRDSAIQPNTDPPSQYCYFTSLRSNSNLSPSQFNRSKSHPNYSSLNFNSNFRPIFHSPSGIWILWSTIHNFRCHLWIYLFYSNRISRTSRNHWFIIFNSMLIPTHNIPLFPQPPLWIWSSSLILALRRRSMTILVYFNLLMRRIKYLFSINQYIWLPIKKFI